MMADEEDDDNPPKGKTAEEGTAAEKWLWRLGKSAWAFLKIAGVITVIAFVVQQWVLPNHDFIVPVTIIVITVASWILNETWKPILVSPVTFQLFAFLSVMTAGTAIVRILAAFAHFAGAAIQKGDPDVSDFLSNRNAQVGMAWGFAAAVTFTTTLLTIVERFRHTQNTIADLQRFTTTMVDKLVSLQEDTVTQIQHVRTDLNAGSQIAKSTIDSISKVVDLTTAHQQKLLELNALAEQIGNPDKPKTKPRKKSADDKGGPQ